MFNVVEGGMVLVAVSLIIIMPMHGEVDASLVTGYLRIAGGLLLGVSADAAITVNLHPERRPSALTRSCLESVEMANGALLLSMIIGFYVLIGLTGQVNAVLFSEAYAASVMLVWPLCAGVPRWVQLINQRYGSAAGTRVERVSVFYPHYAQYGYLQYQQMPPVVQDHVQGSAQSASPALDPIDEEEIGQEAKMPHV